MQSFRSPSSWTILQSILILLISVVLTTVQAVLPDHSFISTEKQSAFHSLAPLPFVARHGLTSSQYQALFNTVVPQGYRLLQITGYVSAGEDHFAALFEQSPGPPQICHHGLTSSGYQQAFEVATAQGYRPVLVNGYTSASGSDKYVAIFEKPTTSPPWVARHGMTSATYQQEFNTWTLRGFKLTHVSGYSVGSEARYAAIFEKISSSPAWIARHGLTSSQYQAEFEAQVRAGFTLTLVSGYAVGNVDFYAAIFEKKSDGRAWVARHGLTGQAYQGEFMNQYYQGYRLKCISGYTISNAARYAAIWENQYVSPSDLNRINTPLQSYMTKHSVPGISIAITRNDSLVFAKGFGLANTNTGERVSPDHLFRIASVSKSMTAITVMMLIEQKRLALNSKVFGRGAILGTTFGTKVYSQWTRDITVQQLLEHTSGYSNAGGDPVFMHMDMTRAELITWVLDNRQPTSAPGSKYQYLNFGYCLLGRVIERVTGQPYEPYLRNNILVSSPQSPNRMAIADIAPKPNEVTYYPSGAYILKVRGFDAFGGWLARPIDLVGVLSRADGFTGKKDIISRKTLATMWTGSSANSGYGKGWILSSGWRGHNGAMIGTISFLVRRDDGFGFAVTANTRPSGDGFAFELKGVIDRIIGSVGAWPAYDLF